MTGIDTAAAFLYSRRTRVTHAGTDASGSTSPALMPRAAEAEYPEGVYHCPSIRAAADRPRGPAGPSAHSMMTTSPLVLVVEDNPLNADMLSRRLVRRGYRVVAAGDGLAAIAAAHEHMPAIILMDMDLPKLDGWEATRRIKADPATAQIPVIALTAHALAEHKDRALDAGCDDYEPKPFDFTRLLGRMAALMAGPPD